LAHDDSEQALARANAVNEDNAEHADASPSDSRRTYLIVPAAFGTSDFGTRPEVRSQGKADNGD
jgi:hypothetical protein